MEKQKKTDLPSNIQTKIYEIFAEQPISHKLVIYAKFMHSSNFKAQNGDLFGLNRRSISKIYRSFIEKVKDIINA